MSGDDYKAMGLVYMYWGQWLNEKMTSLMHANPVYHQMIMDGTYGTPRAWTFENWYQKVYCPRLEKWEEMTTVQDEEDAPF